MRARGTHPAAQRPEPRDSDASKEAEMTAPHSASSGRPEGTQASQPETVVPRQRQADAGRGAVEEIFVERRLATLGRTAWLVVLAAAVGAVAIGILLLVWPSATLTVVAILLGASLLV